MAEHPNPIIASIDAGHYSRLATKKETAGPGGGVCQNDGEPWPCAHHLEARGKAADRARQMSVRKVAPPTPFGR